MIRRLDTSERVAEAGDRMTAPAAARNLQVIADILVPRLPAQGTVLEIASGTGQHVAAWAASRPDLSFQPTEPDAARRKSIDAWCQGLANVDPAQDLDACQRGWSSGRAVDGIVIVNLLHLISDAELAVLLDEVAQALGPDGSLAIYGPFLRDGRATSEGDARFDASLRAQDPAVGYKDIAVLRDSLPVLGFVVEVLEMPANNLMVLARKTGLGL